MRIASINSKARIESYYGAQRGLHIYEIGDLDDFFFPNTKWLALMKGEEEDGKNEQIHFLALQYQAPDLTVILAFASTENERGNAKEFFRRNLSAFPDEFYSHFTPETYDDLLDHYSRESHGLYAKMLLQDLSWAYEKAKAVVDSAAVRPRRLLPSQLPEILRFYEEAYPGNWFDPRMLETGQTFGIFLEEKEVENSSEEEKLVAIAGIHVFSEEYSVASLGNIATLPGYRGRGYGRIVTAALLRSLIEAGVTTIGLNVRADNPAAIRCYESLGFRFLAHYEENMWRRKKTTREEKKNNDKNEE